MTIKYMSHTILECTHVDTKQKFYQLKHWYVSDKSPQYAGCKDIGYFESYKEAEDFHRALLSKDSA